MQYGLLLRNNTLINPFIKRKRVFSFFFDKFINYLYQKYYSNNINLVKKNQTLLLIMILSMGKLDKLIDKLLRDPPELSYDDVYSILIWDFRKYQ